MSTFFPKKLYYGSIFIFQSYSQNPLAGEDMLSFGCHQKKQDDICFYTHTVLLASFRYNSNCNYYFLTFFCHPQFASNYTCYFDHGNLPLIPLPNQSYNTLLKVCIFPGSTNNSPSTGTMPVKCSVLPWMSIAWASFHSSTK